MELLALAFVSLGALTIQHLSHQRALAREQAHTASLLERISTEPRIELRPAQSTPLPDPRTPKYISDEPYMDPAWNEFRGEQPDEVTA